MDIKNKSQNILKAELEQLAKRKLSNSESWESYFNLEGFIRVLRQMRKEKYAKTI